MSGGYRRGVPGPPRRKDCDHCGAPIVFVREVDSSRTFVLNADPVEGGTVVLLNANGPAQEVPPGRGRGYTIHTCRRGEG